MKYNLYILKLAIGAVLTYAIGNTVHSGNVVYMLYGAVLVIHPIAGDTIGYVLDKLKADTIGSGFGMLVDIAFQANEIATLTFGPIALMAGGYGLGFPHRILLYAMIVIFIALGSSGYSNEPFTFIGLRFWNIVFGSLIGIAVNVTLWPDRDVDKLGPAFARAIASIRDLYDRVIDDYRQGRLAANAQSRKQLAADIEGQLGAIDSLLGNAKYELVSPFSDAIVYQRWIALDTRVKSLFGLVVNLSLAIEGGDGDRLYGNVQAKLEDLVRTTRATFDRFSQPSAFRPSQPSANPLANLPALNEAIQDRLSRIDSADRRPADLDPGEIMRVAASIYCLSAIASELNNLVETIDGSVAQS